MACWIIGMLCVFIGATFGALAMAIIQSGARADRGGPVNHVNRGDDDSLTRYPPRFPPR